MANRNISGVGSEAQWTSLPAAGADSAEHAYAWQKASHSAQQQQEAHGGGSGPSSQVGTLSNKGIMQFASKDHAILNAKAYQVFKNEQTQWNHQNQNKKLPHGKFGVAAIGTTGLQRVPAGVPSTSSGQS